MTSRRHHSVMTYVWSAAVVVLLICGQAGAQTVSGTISGTVVDSTGAVIPSATVTLTSEATGTARSAESNPSGEFVFSAVPPATYTLKVEKTGFQAYERRGNVLTATQRLPLGNIQLSIGQVTQTINVTSQGETVNTESGDITALLSANQLDLAVARGRDVINILKILPGVSQITSAPWGELSESDPGLGTSSPSGMFGTFSPNISGTRSYWNNMTLDGQPADTTGIRSLFDESLSMDSVAEVKVSQNTYLAEYGRNPGAAINIVSKGGTRDFHGAGYWYKRHENYGANNFFDNRAGLAKPLYRYSAPGFTIGGPVYLPNRFNTNKDKLFFFFATEYWKIRQPGNLRYFTMPTTLERGGDFSQSLDQDGQLIPVIDPLTHAQFPGNIVPANRINSNAQALLNVLPKPNQLNRSLTHGVYNYNWEENPDQAKIMQLLRFDYHPTSKDTVFVRLRRWNSDFLSYVGGNVAFNDLNLVRVGYWFSLDSALVGWTRAISPTLVNEFNVGQRGEKELPSHLTSTLFNPVQRANVGFNLGQFYPSANPYGFVPEMVFGGVPSAGNISYDNRLPLNASMQYTHFLDNLSYARGGHTFKFGVYYEHVWNTYGRRATGSPSGHFDFSRNPNNPGDANWPYATALLGNFNFYQESNYRTTGRETITSVEWFAQDTWKVTRKLTLNYGLRFSYAGPWIPFQKSEKEAASFAFSRYNPSQTPVFYRPALDAGGNRVSVNPVTGAFGSQTLIGAFVPNTGNVVNGMVVTGDSGFPLGFINTPSIQLGPRLGFAYDLFGDGKTAIRGGFGSAKETQPSVNPVFWTTASNPPLIFTPNIFYGNMSTLLSSQGVLFPSSSSSVELNMKVPTVYNYSLGIQRQVGFNTLLDVSYIGNVGRHLLQRRDYNTLPYGARFLAKNQDPTTGGALPDTFLRPFPEYTSLPYLEAAGISNYNSLQVAVNRRFTSGLQFGVAYTWSKTMDYTDAEDGLVGFYRPPRIWNYGKAGFDQSHMLVLNYQWPLPKASKVAPNPVVRWVFDNWKVSGITTFATGLPNGIGFSTTDNADITGGGDGARVVMVGPAQLGHGERTLTRWFNTAAFGRPAQGTFGNAPKDVFRGPGLNNWDIALMKDFPLKSESRYFQFRWDMYNAFNHTQFMSIDSGARFDPAGHQVNGQFGQAVAARPPRIMQLTLRLEF